jgi:hypothetical protein
MSDYEIAKDIMELRTRVQAIEAVLQQVMEGEPDGKDDDKPER